MGNTLFKRIAKRLLIELTGGYNKTWRFMKRKQLIDKKIFFGSQWICVSDNFEKWIEKYLKENPQYIKFYQHVNCPDESFFQTLIMNSPYKSNCSDYLHYIDWEEGANSPRNLQMKDIDIMLNSGYKFARKFDDMNVIRMLDSKIKDKING